MNIYSISTYITFTIFVSSNLVNTPLILNLIKSLPNHHSRTFKDRSIEIQIKDELQFFHLFRGFLLLPLLLRQTYFPWPLQRIRVDEYLSFRIIDHAKAVVKEKDWHFIKFSQNFNSNSKFFANVTDIVEILLLFIVCQTVCFFFTCL